MKIAETDDVCIQIEQLRLFWHKEREEEAVIYGC